MDSRLLDQLRRSATDIENAVVDEFLAGVSGGGRSCATAACWASQHR
jgi:hypothetical protein